MELMLCLDDRDGLLFNHRRQSRDVEVCRKALQLAAGRPLWMNAYSEPLFQTLGGEVAITEQLYENAGSDDICFAERELPAMEQVHRLYVFRWNRVYPSDVKFSPEDTGFRMTGKEEFQGNSHALITLEVYER